MSSVKMIHCCSVAPWCTHTCTCAVDVNTHTNISTHGDSHYEFCKDSKENICVLKVLPVIFSYFFPPAVIIFSPVKQIKTPRPNGGWGSGSDFPLSGSQTRCSYKQALCKETWPDLCTVTVHACRWPRADFQVSENRAAHSVWTVLSIMYANMRLLLRFSNQYLNILRKIQFEIMLWWNISIKKT